MTRLKTREGIISILVVTIPAVIYLIHAFRFGSWIVDDAGITFAYARNFAQGHGLVSQPGMPPVEGYSNFAWLVLLSPFFLLNIFDPVTTPKIISFLLVIGTFVVIMQMLKPVSGWEWIAFATFTLVSLNTSFVVWTISGLENPLLVFLISLMLWESVRISYEGKTSLRNGIWLGILAALIGMTRPDGLAFVLTFPVILIPARKIAWRRKGSLLLTYAAVFAALYGLFIGFRLAYFGAPLPNTYYMKGGPEQADIEDFLTLDSVMTDRSHALLQRMVGDFNNLLPWALVGGSILLLVTRRWSGRAWAILIFLLCSLSIYLLLPPDWMGEYRFATVFFLLFYLYCALIAESVVRLLPKPIYPIVMFALISFAAVATLNLYHPRTQTFSRSPTVPFQDVRIVFADRFNWYAETLGLEDTSVLLPDVGGMLYYSNLRVYDLGGLTDRTIAQTLGKDIDRPAFYDYVFETTLPTFIHTHGHWTQLTQLENDPRFTVLYVPICNYTDPYVERTYHAQRQSGDFVLRDIAEANPDQINTLREGLDENCNLR